MPLSLRTTGTPSVFCCRCCLGTTRCRDRVAAGLRNRRCARHTDRVLTPSHPRPQWRCTGSSAAVVSGRANGGRPMSSRGLWFHCHPARSCRCSRLRREGHTHVTAAGTVGAGAMCRHRPFFWASRRWLWLWLLLLLAGHRLRADGAKGASCVPSIAHRLVVRVKQRLHAADGP